jgi:hypothetical protein
MTNTINAIPDNIQDEITKILTKLNNITSWTTEKQHILKGLIASLEKSQYKQLILKEHRYKVGKVGNSFIYQVSENRRGLFAPFRGKSIRVICVTSGRFDRTVMVKEIN